MFKQIKADISWFCQTPLLLLFGIGLLSILVSPFILIASGIVYAKASNSCLTLQCLNSLYPYLLDSPNYGITHNQYCYGNQSSLIYQYPTTYVSQNCVANVQYITTILMILATIGIVIGLIIWAWRVSSRINKNSRSQEIPMAVIIEENLEKV